MLPRGAKHRLSAHLESVRQLHQRDLKEGAGTVALPDALARKYPNAAREWGWQWVFPASSRYFDKDLHKIVDAYAAFPAAYARDPIFLTPPPSRCNIVPAIIYPIRPDFARHPKGHIAGLHIDLEPSDCFG